MKKRTKQLRIVIGSLQCEGNSLTPVLTRREDFDYATGEAMYDKLHVKEYLESEGCQLIPTIYAHALPGGAVIKEDFLSLVRELVDGIPTEGVDGIWLCIHGAMHVQEIGSGDTYLLKAVREKVGYDIPLAVAMDFHANNTNELVNLANCVTAFRTAPHCDHRETQLRAAKLLLQCIREDILPKPQMARVDVAVCGDAVQTALEPLKGIMELAEECENRIPGMMCVQVFNGQSWVDEPYMGPSIVATHRWDENAAAECAAMIARRFYDVRHEFGFQIEALEPMEAIYRAMEEPEQVFLSDSGDNTTAGAAGDNAYMINRIQRAGAKNVLIAGIADAAACEQCYQAALGDILTLQVGGSLDASSESAVITGKLIHRGDILSYTGGNGGPSATLDCGNMTVVVTANRAALCRPDIFASIDLDYSRYKIIVVKLGYLFPELAAQAKRAILAFTPGSSTERLQDMNMKNIRRPMFPLDDDFIAKSL